MKYTTIYPITAAQITAQYRLTIDGLLTFHESTIARYLTTLNLAAFDVQKEDRTWDTFVGLIMNESGQEPCRVSSHWLEKEPLPDIATVNLVRNPVE